VAGPDLDKRPVDREVFVGDQPVVQGLCLHAVEEPVGDLTLEQPLAVLAEHTRCPDRLVHVESDEPAEQKVVVELLHQQPLAADGIKDLEGERAQQLLRRDRRAPDARVELGEVRGEILQDDVDDLPDGSQRVVLGNPRLRRDVAEQVHVVSVVSAHRAALLVSHPTSSRGQREREEGTFSGAC